MKSLVKIYNLFTNDDIIKIRNIVSNYEGIIACEINLNKKEVNLVYDELILSIDKVVESIENAGYVVKKWILVIISNSDINFLFKKKNLYDKIIMLLINMGEVFFNGIFN